MYSKNSCGCGRADQWQRERQAAQSRPQAASVPAARNDLRLSRAYVPFQTFGERFAPAEALQKGSLFVALYQPYC